MLGNLNQADAQALMQLAQGRHLRVLEGPILRRRRDHLCETSPNAAPLVNLEPSDHS